MKLAPMPWILCGPGLPPDRSGESSGSTATILSDGRRGFSTWPTPVMVPPVPTPATKTSIFAAGVVPDLLGRGAAMDLRVRRIVELARDDRAGDFLLKLLGLVDGSLHAERPRRQHQLGAEKRQHLAPLDRHRLRHREDQPIAACRGDEGKRDAGIARGRLDERAARLDLAVALERVDHAHPDAVLDARDRVEELELRQEIGLDALLGGEAFQPHDRRVADRRRDVLIDASAPGRARGWARLSIRRLCHRLPSLTGTAPGRRRSSFRRTRPAGM